MLFFFKFQTKFDQRLILFFLSVEDVFKQKPASMPPSPASPKLSAPIPTSPILGGTNNFRKRLFVPKKESPPCDENTDNENDEFDFEPGSNKWEFVDMEEYIYFFYFSLT